MSAFAIDPRILESSAPLAQLPLCEARLQADARFAWIVLVPRREGAREIEDLAVEDLAALSAEIILAGRAVRAVGEALGRPVEKLNIGALGNRVAQLHVHVVGRRADDLAWPDPVWGFGQCEPYDPGALSMAIEAAKQILSR